MTASELERLRLRAAPTFRLAWSMDGRAYVAKEVEPYAEYWLTERDRTLLALFPAAGSRPVGEALDAWLRLTGLPATPARRASLVRAVAAMREAGVLMAPDDDTSRYDKTMAEAYLQHRPIPQEIVDLIVRDGAIGAGARVLDLAGGPGNLALPLARASNQVTMIELSSGFVAAARAEARRQGLALKAVHESCNRLGATDETFDVVTVSQALHWLDDVAVCRGLTRILADAGHFFVVHSALELADEHPLSWVLGDRTPLGDKTRLSFEAEVLALQRRLALLFEALDAPDVQRVDPLQPWDGLPRIAPAAMTILRQHRTFDAGFARAFLSERHIAPTGLAPDAFWPELEARCAQATPGQRLGIQHWAVLEFARGAAGLRTTGLGRPVEIGEVRSRAA